MTQAIPADAWRELTQLKNDLAYGLDPRVAAQRLGEMLERHNPAPLESKSGELFHHPV